jgi:hypothetical protein
MGRAKATVILLVLSVACEALMIGHSLWMLSFIEAARDGEVDLATGETIDAVGAVLGLAYLGSFVGTVIAFSMWFHRVVFNSRQIAGGLPSDALAASRVNLSKAPSPGWAVGSFFIPILCLFRPVQAMLFAWRATGVAVGRARSAVIVRVWWLFWIVSNLLSNVSFRLSLNTSEERQTLDWLAGLQWVDLASSATGVVSGVLVVMIVKRLSGMQKVLMTA